MYNIQNIIWAIENKSTTTKPIRYKIIILIVFFITQRKWWHANDDNSLTL
jgi:hypothetical protein